MLVAVAVLMPVVVAATRPMHMRRRCCGCRPLAYKLHRHCCRRRGVRMVVVAVVVPAAGAVHMAVVVMIVGLVCVAMVLMSTARPMHMSVIMVVPARGWGHIGCKTLRHLSDNHVPVAQGVAQGGIGLYQQVVGFHRHRHTLLAQAISRAQQVGWMAMLGAWADAPQQLGCGPHHRQRAIFGQQCITHVQRAALGQGQRERAAIGISGLGGQVLALGPAQG